MYTRILLATRDQEERQPARVAAQLCRQLGGRLTILSVYPRTSGVFGEPTYSGLLQSREQEADAALARAGDIARSEGVAEPELEAVEGEPAERIVELAGAGDFDLIVVGTRRRGRLQAALLGSVSADVAAHARVPVLVVPEPRPVSLGAPA